MDINIKENKIDVEIKNNIVNIDNNKSDILVEIERPNVEVELVKNEINVSVMLRGPKGEDGTGGSGKYEILSVKSDYIAEQLTGNYLFNCANNINITLPQQTDALFTIRNNNGIINITNEVNGQENRALKYRNSSITLICIGDGKYNII